MSSLTVAEESPKESFWTRETVLETARTIQPYIAHTAVRAYGALDDGRTIWIADETAQPGGSFKSRGAFAKVKKVFTALEEAGLPKNARTISAGNFAAGFAYATKVLDGHGTTYLPDGTPIVKIDNIKMLGGDHITIVKGGTTFEDCVKRCTDEFKGGKIPIVHPYDDETVVLAHGMPAYELLQEHPDLDHIAVPAGGGGLLAGTMLAINELGLNTKVHGVKLSHERQLCEGANVRELGNTALQVIEALPHLYGGLIEVELSDVGKVVTEEKSKQQDLEYASKYRFPEATALLGIAMLHKYAKDLDGKVGTVLTGSNADHTNLDHLQRFYVAA